MIYFLDGVFNKKSEKYRIYEAGLSQSRFSISGQGIIITYINHSFMEIAHLWHFRISADISCLDESLILGLPFCIFAGYSVLT